MTAKGDALCTVQQSWAQELALLCVMCCESGWRGKEGGSGEDALSGRGTQRRAGADVPGVVLVFTSEFGFLLA